MDDQTPASDAVVEPQGRLALASFGNNIVNVNPAQYVWVKNFSNFLLCHKASEAAAPPRRALFWIVGDLEKVSLSTAEPYSSWFVDIRLSPAANKALGAIVKTGPYKTYTPPNLYSMVRVKATLKSVLDDIASDEEDNTLSSVDDRSPFPFTYDGRALTATGVSPPFGYDVGNFDDQSTVAVEVALLGWKGARLLPRDARNLSSRQRRWWYTGHAGETQGWLPPQPEKAEGRPFCLRSVEAFLRYANTNLHLFLLLPPSSSLR
jgi:hypothetical protein